MTWLVLAWRDMARSGWISFAHGLAITAFGGAILAESSLTFLGLGISPLIPTWGSMIADGRNYLTTAWWISAFPGLVLTSTVLSIYFLGDGLRDVLDPRLRL